MPGPEPDRDAAPRIDAIHLADAARGPVRAVPEATAVAGRGLLGDRYERGAGTFSDWPRDHELTLVEAEVIEDLARHHDIHLAPGEHRRNVTTRGVRLNDLVGRRFRLGADVECEGTRLCEPCDHLEAVTARPNLCRLMAGRGGLRARIVTSGTIRAGDSIFVPSRSASNASREEIGNTPSAP
jgi:hypothetical protein